MVIPQIYIHLLNSGGDLRSVCTPFGYDTSSTAQRGGGSFKNRKRIGEIDCCE